MDMTPDRKVVEHVLDAISNQVLPAGTKLGEQELSEIFACNRTHVRRALAVLAAYHVVEHVPNRGAFVAVPTEQDARDVFEARRAIEAMICENIVRREIPGGFESLRAHLERERQALERGDRAESIRLSREFHLGLARLAGNAVLTGYLEELTMRSSLILGLSRRPLGSVCRAGEHGALLDALEARDLVAARDLSERHLRHVEAQVVFGSAPGPRGALAELLSPQAAPSGAPLA